MADTIRWTALGMITGGALVGLSMVSSWQSPSPQAEAAPPRDWEAQAVSRRMPFPEAIHAFGYVEMRQRPLYLAAPEAGIVTDVLIEPGQRVSEGQSLVRLDASGLEAKLKTAEVEVAAIDAKFKAERIDEAEFAERYERVRELVQIGAASRRELDEFSHRLRKSRARLVSLKVERKLAASRADEIRVALSRRELRAPEAGKVWTVTTDAGAYVVPHPDDPLVVLEVSEGLALRVLVSEHEAANLRLGVRARAYLPGEADVPVQLAFVRIEPEAYLQEKLGEAEERFFQVVFRILQEDVAPYPLVVGQRLEVFLERAKKESAVPSGQGLS